MLSTEEANDLRRVYEDWLDRFEREFKLSIRPRLVIRRVGGYAGIAYGISAIVISDFFWRQNREDMVADTIPHEIAHCYCAYLYPHAKQGHGPEWRGIMRRMGLVPNRCHSYDVTGVVKRRSRNFVYSCQGCKKEFELTVILHRKIQRGEYRVCKGCRTRIVFVRNKAVETADGDVKFI